MRNTAYYLLLWIALVSPCYAFICNTKNFKYAALIRSRSLLYSVAGSTNPVADEIDNWSTQTQKEFIYKYWQKRPVIIRNAITNIEEILKLKLPEDLLELSYDDDVESRYIVKNGCKYIKTYGPFSEGDFDDVGDKDWTILVQDMDRHIPSVANLWDNFFDFIPAWRRDDIMISYACEGGGIGGHVDNYDVFLLQGKGKREWSIENCFLSSDEEKKREVPNIDTRLLKDFHADQAWVLNAGDMLYLPPRIPHQGISLGGGCTTVSLGFRAPAYRSMVTALCDYVCQKSIPEDLYYSDPDLDLQNSVSLIPDYTRDKIAAKIYTQLTSVINDTKLFDDWLGVYLTTPLRMQMRTHKPFFIESIDDKEEAIDDENDYSYDDELPFSVRSTSSAVVSQKKFPSTTAVVDALYAGEIFLRRSEGTKMAYNGENNRNLYVNGVVYLLPKDAAYAGPLLADNRIITCQLLSKAVTSGSKTFLFNRMLGNLIKRGYYYPVDTLLIHV